MERTLREQPCNYLCSGRSVSRKHKVTPSSARRHCQALCSILTLRDLRQEEKAVYSGRARAGLGKDSTKPSCPLKRPSLRYLVDTWRARDLVSEVSGLETFWRVSG